MHLPRSSTLALLVVACLTVGSASADSDKSSSSSATTTTATTTTLPCTATSTSGAFFDLRLDEAVREEEGVKPRKGSPTSDYVARGYDLGYNFTLNICGPVVKPVDDVEGVARSDWKHVGAYYTHKGDVFSLGEASTKLVVRGRKLVLQYVDGSPCEPLSSRSTDSESGERRRAIYASKPVHDGASYKYSDYNDDSDRNHPVHVDTAAAPKRRKSALISFQCDALQSPTAVSFVGADPDECAYYFEARSAHACAGVADLPRAPGSVGPGSVFGIILLVAVLVYLVGGVFYQRTVAHARGWRQLPNYSLWSSIWSFLTVGLKVYALVWRSVFG